jgi:hypothetical protein
MSEDLSTADDANSATIDSCAIDSGMDSGFDGSVAWDSIVYGDPGGDSGSMVVPCETHLNCDDRNPCTKDSCVAGKGCLHQPLPDDTPCNDGNICTAGDQCKKAQCQGETRESKAELLSSLYSYGGYREDDGQFQGTSLVFEGNRIVFIDPLWGWGGEAGSMLSLVKVTEQGRLELLDQLPTSQSLNIAMLSMWLWYDAPIFDMFSLGQDRFVVAGSAGSGQFRASVFDIVDNHLVERSEIVTRVSGSLVSTAGGGDRFWRLTFSGIDEFLVSPEGIITQGLSQVSMNEFSGVQTIWSDERKTLYQAKLSGIARWDLSTGQPTKMDMLWAGHSFMGVAVNANYIATQEVTQDLGASRVAALNVYRLDDLALVATFPADDYHQPVAFAFVDPGILVEWYISEGPIQRLVSTIYRISGAEPEALSEQLVWKDCCNNNRTIPPVRMSYRGSLAVLAPWQQVISLEANGVSQRKVTGIGHGGLTQVKALGRGLATAFDAYSSELIDLSNPRAPVFTTGGLFDTRQTHAVQLYRSETESGICLLPIEANEADSLLTPSNQVTLLRADKGSRALPAGGIDLGEDPGFLFASGASAYLLNVSGTAGYRLRRYEAGEVSDGQDLTAVADQVVTVTREDAAKLIHTCAAADSFTRSIVIADQRGEFGDYVQSLYWIEEGETGFALRGVASVPTGDNFLYVLAAARGRALVLSSDALRVFELDGVSVSLKTVKVVEKPDAMAKTTTEFEPDRILSFDGKRALLTGRFSADSSATGFANIVMLDTETWETLGAYTASTVIETAEELDGNWLLGSETAVHVITPGCRAK